MAKPKGEIQGNAKSGTIIARCSCTHAFQDKRYGSGLRLMNLTSNGKGRCTVCSKVNDK
jgi:hypothetical protein